MWQNRVLFTIYRRYNETRRNRDHDRLGQNFQKRSQEGVWREVLLTISLYALQAKRIHILFDELSLYDVLTYIESLKALF